MKEQIRKLQGIIAFVYIFIIIFSNDWNRFLLGSIVAFLMYMVTILVEIWYKMHVKEKKKDGDKDNKPHGLSNN